MLSSVHDLVDPDSATGRMIVEKNWAATPVGPPHVWPEHLRVALSIVQGARFPMALLWGPDRVQFYNDQYAPLLSDRHPVALGATARETWPDVWDVIEPMLRHVERTGVATWSENHRFALVRNGRPEECFFTFSFSPVRGAAGKVEGILATALETTAEVLTRRRQQTLEQMLLAVVDHDSEEEALARCAGPLAASLDDVPFARVYLASPDGATPKVIAQHGEAATDAWEPAAREVLAANEPRRVALEGGEAEAFLLPIRAADEGDACGVLVAGLSGRRPFSDDYRYFLEHIAEHFGVTLARARRLRRVENERIAVLERMADCFYAVDRNWRMTYLNAAAEKYLGKSRSECAGRTLFELFPRFAGSELFHHYERAMREQVPVHFETPGVARSGMREVHTYPSAEGLTVLFRDISPLREAEQRYRTVFEQNPFPMWLYEEPSLQIVNVNAAAQERYGYSRSEFLSLRITDLRPPEEVPRLMEQLRQMPVGLRTPGVYLHQYKDGSVHQVEVTAIRVDFGEVQRVLVVANDLTEKLALEEQLRHAQKMEAVGQLAGGVAHDFNNLLAVISSNLRLSLPELPEGSELREAISDATDAASRAIGLTRQLLTFSRRQEVEVEVLELNQLVGDAERMLRRLIREDIQLETRLGERLPGVRADRGQLEQVLVNLVVNARDAMPSGGTITVETSEVRSAEERWLQLAVRDTGHGMDEATRRRIFEPFFTTKEVGKGTGLGLATVYGIVDQLGGRIDVDSTLGAGATFRILIPVAEEVDEPPEPSAPVAISEEALAGTERILVVEDEAIVRGAIRRVLERRGYGVVEAPDGEAALEVLASEGARVDLVLTDLVMPKMGGRALATQVRERHPSLPVLLMSGYDREATLQPGVAFEHVDVAKPFAPSELLGCLRRVLDSGVVRGS